MFQLVKFTVLQFQFYFWQKSFEGAYSYRAHELMISKYYVLMETAYYVCTDLLCTFLFFNFITNTKDLTFSGLFVSLLVKIDSTKRRITWTDVFALYQILHLQNEVLKGLVNN